MKGKTGGLIAGIAGIVLLGLGAGLGWGAFPSIIKGQVEDNIDLKNNETDGFINFIKPPVDLYMKFTFFHVLNGDKVVTNMEKAKFEEKGPYAYREVKEKINLRWTNDQESLQFEQYRHFEFDKEQSCKDCSKDDKVKILNMPLIGAVAAAMKESPTLGEPVLNILGTAIDNSPDSKDLFLEDTVDNILFQGVNNDLVAEVLENGILKKQLPPAIQDNGFAIFNTKNATTHNECYEVDVGVERHTEINLWGPTLAEDDLNPDLSEARTCPSVIAGEVFSCRSTKNFPYWWPYKDIEGNERINTTCNLLRGTNGEQFPPFLDDRRDEPLWIFSTDLCRSMSLKYLEDHDIDGIRTLRYTLPQDSANVNQTDNVCFCKELAEKWDDPCIKRTEDPNVLDIKECQITTCHDGVQDISNCMMSPVKMSSPHFYLAEAQLENFESGLTPDADLHMTILDIEPITGMTVSAHKRIQVNMPITPTGIPNIIFLENIIAVPAFPVLWLDEGADIDQENIDKIKSMVTTPLLLLDIAKYSMLGLGAASLLLGMVLFFACK